MAKISNFIIGLALVSLIVGGFGIYFGHLSTNYNVAYDESNLDAYNNIDKIYNTTKEIEQEATNIDPQSNPLQQLVSIIDGFFTGAYNTLLLAWSSFDVFDTVADQSMDNLNIGEYSYLFKITLTLIVMVLLIIGVIVSAIVKRDL